MQKANTKPDKKRDAIARVAKKVLFLVSDSSGSSFSLDFLAPFCIF